MDPITALILGLIQGLTEFLPISSSGHLELIKVIFQNKLIPEESLLFTIILHGATALSTLVIFRKEVFFIIKYLFKFKKSPSSSLSMNIIISMIPASIVGVFFEENISKLFTGNLILVGFMLLVTALILIFADTVKENTKTINVKNSFFIGLAQAIAILPGISRSGSTIGLAIFFKINKKEAAKFSFLMVIPLIIGSMIKSLLDFEGSFLITNYISLIIGFISAFFSGLFACKWMIAFVQKSKLWYFSLYCISIGLISIYFGFR